ncbi:hypothetical protein SAMN04487947_4075 [Halogeometricum rufum]|uniref:Uncharacterized protein n=1 Tax=Halogeometricum rufum TaxID=553469 RepID=A0A1I6J5R1_9EURY|nr:hypothetical protein [Halogeometricum rufum]SFR74257.1 hypothetical protein SAMN04487947_4075 [Halogeometricum rufum]
MSPPLSRRSEPTSPRWTRALLLVGFLGLAVAVLAARSKPATGYEVSIYAATPPAFWVGVVGAAAVGAVATLFGRNLVRAAGVGLAGLATVAFLSLPLVRGYYYYGSGDALTHLGWAKRMLNPEFGFFDIIYPGGHSLALFLSQSMGVPVRWGMMYAMLTVSVLALLFVPLAVWVVTRDSRAVVIAAFTAMLMLPINNISTHSHFHSYTLTTLYFPFVLYLLFKHLTRSAEDTALPSWASAASLVLPVALMANVFYHPQVAVNVLIFMGTVLAVGLVWRRRVRVSHPTATDGGQRHRLIVGQVVFLAVLLAVWATQYQQTFTLLNNVYLSAQAFLTTGTGAGQVAAQRGGSAQSIGVSIVELFVKLFAVNAIYVVIATAFMAALVFGMVSGRSDSGVAVAYIGFSAFTLGPFFAVQFIGDVSGYFFRHFGFAMVLVGIVGAIALYHLSDAIGDALDGRERAVVSVLTVAVLCLSLAAFFPSPYMYNPSPQSPEQQFVGYDTVFEHRAEGAAVAGIRGGPGRFSDALNAEFDNRLKWTLSGSEFNSTQNVTRFREYSYSEQPFYYLTVSEKDRARELVAYDSLRYEEGDFERIANGTHPRISHIQTNGEFDTYYVDQRGYPLDPPEQTDD